MTPQRLSPAWAADTVHGDDGGATCAISLRALGPGDVQLVFSSKPRFQLPIGERDWISEDVNRPPTLTLRTEQGKADHIAPVEAPAQGGCSG